jgi:hypothetical protein
MKNLLLFFTIFVLFSCQRTVIRSPAAQKSESIINIVFDIDYTIVQPAKDLKDPDVFKIGEEYYKINNWTRETIESLSRHHNVRISFFSGGQRDRNIKLLKTIKTNSGRSLFEFASSIYSYDDLHQVQEEGRFSERLKKDLAKLDFNLDRTILIDDNAMFTYGNQSDNMLWLGKTYHHYEDFSKTYKDLGDEKVLQEFIPSNFQEWFLARNKLKFVHELIEDAIDAEKDGKSQFLDFIVKNKENYIPYEEKFTDHYRALYTREVQTLNYSCSKAVLSF